jgi:hypothetical protein
VSTIRSDTALRATSALLKELFAATLSWAEGPTHVADAGLCHVRRAEEIMRARPMETVTTVALILVSPISGGSLSPMPAGSANDRTTRSSARRTGRSAD